MGGIECGVSHLSGECFSHWAGSCTVGSSTTNSSSGRILNGTFQAHLLDWALLLLRWAKDYLPLIHGSLWDLGRRQVSEYLEEGSSEHAQRQEHRYLQNFYYGNLRR